MTAACQRRPCPVCGVWYSDIGTHVFTNRHGRALFRHHGRVPFCRVRRVLNGEPRTVAYEYPARLVASFPRRFLEPEG